MNKGLSLLLAGLMVVNSNALAQTGELYGQQVPGSANQANQEEDKAIVSAGLDDLKNPDTSLGKTANKLGSDLMASWQKRSQELYNKLEKKYGPQFRRFIDNYRISDTYGLEDRGIQSLLVDANYQLIIEPNYRNGEQVRRDIYVFGLGASKAIDALSNSKITTAVRGKIQLRLTFSRVFKGPSAKLDAFWATPYMPTKIPFSSNGIKDDMKVGETVRIEILGTGSIGASAGQSKTLGAVSVGANFFKETLFMIDIYRHSELHTRVRMFGLKNRGAFNVGASLTLTPWTAWRPDSSGKIEDQISKRTNVGVGLGGSKSADILNDFPIDTMMIDYLYKFTTAQDRFPENETAEKAIDELLQNVRSVSFLPLLNLVTGNSELDKNLGNRAPLTEKLASLDKSAGPKARVRHLFKGQISSTVSTIYGGAGATKFLGTANFNLTQMKSFVTSENEKGEKDHHILVSSSNNQVAASKVASVDTNILNDVDVLMTADANRKPGVMLDIITTSILRERKLSESDMARLRFNLIDSLPAPMQTEKLRSFLPEGVQSNAYYMARFGFGKDALKALENLTAPEIEMALRNYLEKHVDREKMKLPKDSPETGISYSEYMNQLGYRIYLAVSKNSSPNERLTAYYLLLGDEIFQKYIIGHFFASLVSSGSQMQVSSLELQFSSSETPAKEPLKFGEAEASNVYKIVSFLRSVLNNRSYDLRLETQINPDGTEVLVNPVIRGFQLN